MQKTFKIPSEDIQILIAGMGGCYASDKILVDGEPIGYMYREETEDDWDSGWRFLSGTESDDYVNDPDKVGIYDVNIVANYDRGILPLLARSAPCAFAKSGGTFKEV
jgi:hypothetical protein